ncbi:MAG: hypothetical protein VKI81_07870 [Synechococcaceae cyanobacterium]|nr:hypothetical protein [Synechococcaceae cyanobacterium]
MSPRTPRRGRTRRSLRMIGSSLSSRRVERQAPLIAGVHRAATGALAGLGISMLGLSALTLHWQNRWASSYAELEATKTLEHRLQESSAVLEQHHLGAVRKPSQLVPTSSERLIHLPEPDSASRSGPATLLTGLRSGPIPQGY